MVSRKKIANTIWYGRFHTPEDVHRPRLLPFFGWTACLLAFAALRLSLPFTQTPAGLIHSRILQSLVSGQVWGRQALIGALEYPPLPTLALIFADMAGRVLRLPSLHLLVAISQVYVFFYVTRIPRGWLGRTLTGLILATVMIFTPEVRTIFCRLDPNWIVAAPAACAIYHFVLWGRERSLRDAVLLAINSGLLVFAGAAGIGLALILLLLATCRIMLWNRRETPPARTEGVRLLLWAPTAYAVLLLITASWLIMRNGVFFVKRLLSALATPQPATILHSISGQLYGMRWISCGALAVAFLYLLPKHRRTAAVGLAAGLPGLLLATAALTSLELYASGSEILLLLVALGALLLPFWELDAKDSPSPLFFVTASITALTIAAATVAPRDGIKPIGLSMPDAPTRPEVLAAVDRYTPETRIMIHGVRAPAYYPDIREKRFLPRVDFHPSELISRARAESFMYLLLPPNDGTFYSRTSQLADIHEYGRPWLVLEKAWPGGWQLWHVLTVSERPAEAHPTPPGPRNREPFSASLMR